jgi:pilus assembly protein CpaC
VAQASGTGTSITVQFKEFGIRLNFTPTVNGDRVHLKVRPEVSTLDFNNAVVLNGFRIPALTTRRTETELELQNGQTFAIAGLMNNNMLSSLQKVPGIGDIPILGLLFRSKAAQKQQTELVVMITPEILPNNSSGVTTELPRQQEPYLGPLPQQRSLPPPPPAFQSSNAAPAPTNATRPVEQPGAPAISAGSSPAATTAPAPRQMTDEERRTLEQTRKAERERAAAQARLDAEEAKRVAKRQEEERKKQREEQERLERVAKAQAQRDAEAAKRAAEEAKKQAEIEQERQKQADAAARRLREAQAAYEAEIEKLQRK